MSAAVHAGAMALEVIGADKSFGAFQALDDVSLRIVPGSVHALLGENGAGKSTLVKGLIGYQPLDEGQILLDNREVEIADPRAAQRLGIGMVYQHFTVAPGLSVAENLLLARGRLPLVIRWRQVRAELAAFMERAPFRVPLDAPVASLGAGEKQKLEILKQLYLRNRLLILDEPTSVLTVQEADEVLGLLRGMAHAGELSVLLITHKFGEVLGYADEVTVLRRGRRVAHARVAETTVPQMAQWIMGEAAAPAPTGVDTPARSRLAASDDPRLVVENLSADADRGMPRVHGVSFSVRGGEIGPVTLAGVDHVETLRAERAEHRPNRLDGRAREGDVVAHGVYVAARPAEIGLHVDHERCVGGLEVAVVRPGVGVGVEVGRRHGILQSTAPLGGTG